jgi:hypothetical protein
MVTLVLEYIKMSEYCGNFSDESLNLNDLFKAMKFEMSQKVIQASSLYEFDFVNVKPNKDPKKFHWQDFSNN